MQGEQNLCTTWHYPVQARMILKNAFLFSQSRTAITRYVKGVFVSEQRNALKQPFLLQKLFQVGWLPRCLFSNNTDFSECGTYIKYPVLSGLDGQGHFGPWPGEIGRGKDHLIFTVWPDWSLSSCERCLLHGWQWEPYRRRCGWCWTETWMSTLSSSHLRKKPNST